MPDANDELINSVGIELEFSNMNRNDPKLNYELSNIDRTFRLTHDASCETPSITLLNRFQVSDEFRIKSNFRELLYSNVLGGELVSGIINSMDSNYISSLEKICDLFKRYGEVEDSVRDSLHVHVNVSRQFPHYALKNIVTLAGNLEYILFKLGGMGSINRGVHNRFAYQRPLTGKGFPVISYNDRFAYTGDIDLLLNSKDRREFYSILNDSFYGFSNQIRYVPQRYTSVNLYSSLFHGSVEFRTANKTLNPLYISAWVELCRAIIEKSFKSYSIFYDPLKLHECNGLSKDDFITRIEDLGLSNMTMLSLEHIWDNSSDINFDNIPMATHLTNSYNKFSRNTPQHLIKYVADSSEVIRSEVSTVHNIRMPKISEFITNDFKDDSGRVIYSFDKRFSERAVQYMASNNLYVGSIPSGQVNNGYYFSTISSRAFRAITMSLGFDDINAMMESIYENDSYETLPISYPGISGINLLDNLSTDTFYRLIFNDTFYTVDDEDFYFDDVFITKLSSEYIPADNQFAPGSYSRYVIWSFDSTEIVISLIVNNDVVPNLVPIVSYLCNIFDLMLAE